MKRYRATWLLILMLLLTAMPFILRVEGQANDDSEIYLPFISTAPGKWIASYQRSPDDRWGTMVGILETGQNQYKLIGDEFVIDLNGDGTVDQASFFTSGGLNFAPMSAGRYAVGDADMQDKCYARVALLSPNNTTLWHKVVTLPGKRCANSFDLTASENSIYLHQASLWLTKLDEDGDLAWSKLIGQGWRGSPFDMSATTGGGLVFTGFRSNEGGAVVLAELNGDGQLVRAREFRPSSETTYWPLSVSTTADQGIILTGTNSNDQIWALKLDKQWQISWQKRFTISPFETGLKSAIGLRDGGALLSGIHGKPYLLRIHADGTLAWMRSYGNQTQRIQFNAVEEAGDAGLLIAGSLQGISWHYPLSMKLGPDGLVTNCDLISSESVIVSDLNLVMSPTSVALQDISPEISTLDPGYTPPIETISDVLCSNKTTAENCY